MGTTRETVRLLCKSIVTRLENQKAISFPPRLRQIVQEEIQQLIGPMIVTEQDIRERALAKMGAKVEQLSNTQFTESDQFQTARKIVKSTLGEDELHGMFFQKPLKFIAEEVAKYLMRSTNIEDVYESDQDLEHLVVSIVKGFKQENVH